MMQCDSGRRAPGGPRATRMRSFASAPRRRDQPALDDEAVSIATRASDRLRMVLGAGPTGGSASRTRAGRGQRQVRGDRDRWELHWRDAPARRCDGAVHPRCGARRASGNHHLGMSVRASLRSAARNSEDLPTLQISIPARPTTVARAGASGSGVSGVRVAITRPRRWNFVDCIVYTPDSTVPPPAF